VLFLAVLVVGLAELDPITHALTPFADRWSPSSALALRVLAGVLLVAGTTLLMVLVFSTLTLALGSPIYDAISESIDRACPGAPAERHEPLVAGAGRAVRQSAAMIAVSALGALVFLLVGLVPVVGQVVATVGGAIFGGWMLTLELVGPALERRSVLTLRDRRAVLRRNRSRVLGLGIPCFLLLSVPFVSVVVFPVAVAAGTLLARQLRDEPVDVGR
jgi:CysZ protein